MDNLIYGHFCRFPGVGVAAMAALRWTRSEINCSLLICGWTYCYRWSTVSPRLVRAIVCLKILDTPDMLIYNAVSLGFLAFGSAEAEDCIPTFEVR
jgi:hypothetical protein